MSSFDYTSIPINSSKHEIRLLEILPCQSDPESTATSPHNSIQTDKLLHSRVRCSMRRVCMDDGPEYTALSYTWGGEKDRRLILLDDREVSITASLESALFHLRHASATIILWVDALCINQSNDAEKSEGVQRMKRVYQDATHVVVWLGPSGGDSDITFEVMDQVGKEACDIGFWEIPRKSWLEADSGPYAKFQEFVQERISLDHPFEAIARLTERSWWYRVWVLQEFVLAKDVSFICGTSRIKFIHFAPAIITTNAASIQLQNRVTVEECMDPIKGPKLKGILTNSINPKTGSIIGARRRYHSDPDSHETLIQLLRRANAVSTALNNLQATNPRDRIFGMLGLASDTDQLAIRPDYSKSCEAVYIDTARALLQHGHTDILAFSQFPKNYSDLPKWVPDWTTTIQEPCGGCVTDAFFSASAQLSVCIPPISDSPDAKRLLAPNGCRVDKIAQVGTPWLPTIVGYRHDWAQSVTFISEIEFFCDHSDQLARLIYKSAEQRKEAVWRIPCGDVDRLSALGRRRARSTGPDVLEGFKLLKSGFENEEARRSPDARLHSYTTCMGDMFKRRPFLSEQGYVGLTPSHAEVGDVIVIIYGAIVPFVIRASGDGQFQLVGEAYVHGIMDGEYVEKDPLTETFILC